MKTKVFWLKIWLLYEISTFTVSDVNVAIAILQVVTSVAFSKCFDALKITIAGFKLNVLKKTSEFVEDNSVSEN